MKKYEILHFPYFSDERGDLIPFEFDNKFPFKVKRSYLVTANRGRIRGGHAHIQEDEVFAAVYGDIRAIVDEGAGEEEVLLDRKNKALLVRSDCWHEFRDFSPDAVMLCFSSTPYIPGEDNYITDKVTFLNNIKK